MTVVEQLEFKLELNKALRQGRTFDELFAWPDFMESFQEFVHGRIGRIWLEKPIGLKYQIWQQG